MKDSRSFGERVNTTQGILAIIVSLITLGGSAAVAIKHFTSHKTSTTLTAQNLTTNQVRAALLTSSEFASIDSSLTSSDVALPAVGSCKVPTVKPAINVARIFKDGNTLVLEDEIEIYKSPNDAHAAFGENSQQVTCSFTGVNSTSNISGELRGICDESAAWKITSTNNNGTIISSYLGEIRCGRAVTIFALATPQGSSFDKNYIFDSGTEMTVPKVRELP